ncbi:MAG: magnesium transporter [Acidobacteria bacterium]|nr:magnesium transporter [Acidobacteriota bacterium]
MLYLTEILGLPVFDNAGHRAGRVAELAVFPAAEPRRVAMLLLKADKGKPAQTVPLNTVAALSLQRISLHVARQQLPIFQPNEALLLLRKDLLDQQIIDVHGRKVVRVNDLYMDQKSANHHHELVLSGVDIGVSGALRRLLAGAIPRNWLHQLVRHAPHTVIPWEFVDLLESDPLRRVKLNISHKVLSKLHPADLADIVEELSPKERQAIFTALDNATAAEALSEMQPKVRASILESLDPGRAADIVEEMPPDAAADLLADLPEETASELLQDMEREEAQELGELLEFAENSAGGLMTTDYVAVPDTADVKTAQELIASLPELPENLTTIFLVDAAGRLAGSVALAKLLITAPEQKLLELRSEPLLAVTGESPAGDVIELFDKYNLLTLPVVEDDQRLVGAVTVDDVISLLRKNR